MLCKQNLFIAYTLILAACCLAVSIAETPVTEIYVSNKIALKNPDGSENTPYQNVSAALNRLNTLSSDETQVVIKIDPSSTIYYLNSTNFTLASSNSLNLTISQWKRTETYTSTDSKVILDLVNTTMSFSNLSLLNLEDILIQSQNSSITVRESGFTLYEVITILPVESKTPFISLIDCKYVYLDDIYMSTFEQGLFLDYQQTRKDIIPQVALWNITATIYPAQNKAIAPSVLFNLNGNQAVSEAFVEILQFEARSIGTINFDKGSLIQVDGFQNVTLQNVTIKGQSLLASSPFKVARVHGAEKLKVGPINFRDNQVNISSSSSLFLFEEIGSLKISDSDISRNNIAVSSGSVFKLIETHNVQKIKNNDNILSDNTFDGNVQIISVTEVPSAHNATSVQITNLILINNTNVKSRNQFSYMFFQEQLLDLNITGVEYQSNQLSGRVFSFKSKVPSVRSLTEVTRLYLHNINIQGNQEARDLGFLYFLPFDDSASSNNCLDLLEAYSLEITDLKIWNNSFAQKGNDLWSYKVALFQITQTQVYITNAIIASNIFERYDVISLDQKHSTITFNSSLLDENVFVSSSLINTRYQAVNEFCLPSHERSGSTTLILYRYSFILNTDFNGIQLHSSTLFNLNNAFLLLKNNEFSDMLLVDSSLLSTSVSPMTLLPGTTAYHRNSTLESLVFKNKEENWNLFNETVLLVESKKDQSLYFYVWRENILLNLTTIDSTRLASLTGYSFEQSFIQFSGNQFLEIQSSEELSTMIYVESFANLTISGNIVYGANGGAVLFSLPHAKESAALQINSNQVANSKIAAFSLYSGKSIQGVEIHNNTLEYVRLYVAFVSIRSEIVSGPWKVTSNTFTKCAMIAESALSGSENFAVLSFSNKIAYDKAQVLFKDNIFDSMNLGSLLSSTENLKIDFVSIQCPQNVNIINVTFANFTFYSQGALISAKDMKELSIQNSLFKSLSTNNLNGLIAISSQKILIVRSNFNSIVNREGRGIFSLKNSFANQGVQIIDTVFDTVESDLEGAVLSVRALESEVTAGSVNITLKVSGCQMLNILSGNAIQLNTVNCVGCTFKDTYLNISSTNTVTKNFVSVVGGSIGSLEVSNIVFAAESGLKYPFLGISNSVFEVDIQNTHIDGDGVNEFYLAALDSGSLEVADSVFENIVLHDRAFISVVPTSQTLRHYSNDASFFPNVIFGSTTFRNISNTNRKPYWNDAATTAALIHPISDLLPENEQLRRGLDSEYVDTPFVPAVLFSVIPFGFYSQDTVFEGLSLLPGILLGSAPSWTQEFSRAQSQLMINATVFRDSQYLFGPGLNILPKALTARVSITNSNFTNNTAFVGGAMSIYSAYLTISDSLIKDNHASLVGAAVLTGGSTIIHTNITQVAFQNNTAFYPGDVRSGATDFKLDFIPAASSSIEVGEVKTNTQRRLMLLNASLEEFKSGSLVLNFIDFQGNPAPYFAPVSKSNVEIQSNRARGVQSYFTSACNQNELISANLTIREINIVGKAFEKVDVVFKFSFWNMLRDKTMTVSLRPCVPGEYNNSLSCESCPAGMFTYDPSQRCSECPENAHCSSKNQIVPYPGYWNANQSSAIILQCRADDLQRCTNEDNTRSCAAGYTGPLCEACDFDNSYVEHGYLKCAMCKDPKMSLIYAAVIGVLYFAYQLFSIKAICASNEQSSLDQQTSLMAFRKIERSYYIKSLLTYTQLMSILFLGNSYIYQLFGITAQIGNPSSLVMYGTQCSMKALGIDPANFLYYQAYLSVLSPILQLLLILVILIVVKGVKSSVSVGKFFMTACVYYLVSYQPGLVLNLMQFRSCTTLKGVGPSFLTAHPNWTCDSEQYSFTTKYVVGPALISWCIVLPLFVLIVLVVKKNRSQEQEAKGSYGMLFFDLNSKFYYWGLILMMLKLSLSFLIFGLDKSIELQICISLMLLWAYQSFVKWLSPYKTESFNRLEVLLMNLLMFNIILAKYLLNPSNGFAISEGALIVGIALNGLFLIGLLWKVITLSFLNVVSTVEKGLLDRGGSVDNRHLLNDSNAIL